MPKTHSSLYGCGATGIGRAAAKRFIEEGPFVFIFGRRQAELDAALTVGAVTGTPAGAFILNLDSPASHFIIELGTKRNAVQLSFRSLIVLAAQNAATRFASRTPPGLRGLTAPLCAQTPGLSKEQKNACCFNATKGTGAKPGLQNRMLFPWRKQGTVIPSTVPKHPFLPARLYRAALTPKSPEVIECC
jgi:hypothetical protein